MKKLLLLLVLILVPVVAFFISQILFQKFGKNEIFVSKVLDGDTFQLLDGSIIRLIGINAPNKGTYFYEETKEGLKKLIENKKIFLEKESENHDNYGRLLRYAFYNDIFVNEIMLKNGFSYLYPKYKGKYLELLENAEKEAIENGRGIWARSEFSKCIEIEKFNYDAKGNDKENLNDEFVILKNICDFPINLDGWEIGDSSYNQLKLSSNLDPQASLTIRSGNGTNNKQEFFWKNKFPIWDNDADSLILRDDKGKLVLYYSYSK